MTESDVAIAVLTTALTGVSAAAVGAVIAWRRAARRIQHLEDRLLWNANTDPDASAQNLMGVQLEQLATQVDRLAEGQDFLARIVASRGAIEPSSSATEARVPTPH